MATGAAWDVRTNPARPTARLDMDAIRDIPVDWSDWLDDIGSTYASHTVTAAAPLVHVGSTETEGIIKVRIRTDGTATPGQRASFTVRIVAADGQQDERTLWLKLVQR